MSAPQTSSTDCPEHFQLLALVEGTLTNEDTLVLENHVADCELCDAQLASIEEESDALIRALATLPATQDDESTFRELQADLLAHPESFQGNLRTAATDVLSNRIPVDWVLPLQLGNYELLEQIGAGAHGAVFRGRHRRLEREVAVKLLLHAGGPAVDDFLHEMRVVGQLDHPNIIRATDAGEHDGTYFLVMEFVPGIDVSSLLRQVGPLSVANACEIVRQTALGLAIAHKHGLVHRDVKTSNLLFAVNGQIKLLDLGLATFASPTPEQEHATKSGPRGTADYMAPEQWLEANTVTAAADIYSLGCTLFKLLTGIPPYRSLPAGVLSKQQAHASAAVPDVVEFRDDVPGSLEQLLNQMLAKLPSDRPASAIQVATALERYARGNDLLAVAAKVFPDAGVTSGATTSTKAPLISRRALLAVAVAAAAAAFVPMFWPIRRSSRLQSGQWRALSPADPPILHLMDGDDPEFELENGLSSLTSQEPVLLNLGSPVGKKYRWKTTLKRAKWTSPAGIFFRLRRDSSHKKQFGFHAIELKSTSANESQLLWTAYHITPQGLSAPLVLAETFCDLGLTDDSSCCFEIVLGRSGFPEVRLNDRILPQSKWGISKEGRELIVTSVDQLPTTYAGRIGIFHHEGQTSWRASQIMYLES